MSDKCRLFALSFVIYALLVICVGDAIGKAKKPSESKPKKVPAVIISIRLHSNGTMDLDGRVLDSEQLRLTINEKIATTRYASVQLHVELGARIEQLREALEAVLSSKAILAELYSYFERPGPRAANRPPFWLRRRARAEQSSSKAVKSKRMKPGELVNNVVPAYSETAKKKAKGAVFLQVLVNEQGDIDEIRLLEGPQLLVAESIVAVSQWRYTPPLLDGKPVPMIQTVILDPKRLP
jgi:hypothetical protein